MKKTAMQELYQLIQETKEETSEELSAIEKFVKELMVKEREDLMEAFKTGTLFDQELYFYMSPEEFYDKNYEPIN